MAFTPLKHTQIISLPVSFGDETFTVYYKPFALTYSEFAAFTEKFTAEDGAVSEKLNLMADFLLRVVERADWVDNDGNPLPFDRKTVDNLPFQILNAISSAVITAVSGGGDKS